MNICIFTFVIKNDWCLFLCCHYSNFMGRDTTLIGIKDDYWCSRPTPHNRLFYTFPTFHVPIFLSVHIPLGDTFKPVHLGDTCNTAGTFILTTFTYPHAHRMMRQLRFHSSFVLTRTFSVSSVRFIAHSHHRYFIDSRRIICIRHLCRTFVNRISALLRQTSADFCELSDTLRIVTLMPVAVLEQAFQGVTPSFHLSKYQFFETDL